MAVKKIGVHYDFQKNELQNAAVQNLASAPSSPVEGQMYYDTGTHKLFWYNGTTWVDSSGGTPGAGSITLAMLNAALKPSGSAATTDEAVRALGTSANNAFPGNGRLDQLAVPTADVSMNSHKLTNLLDGTNPQDAITKAQFDAVVAGLDWRTVRAATTANITISTALNNADTLDGVTLATGDLVLVKDQSTASQNGVYVVGVSPARVDWMDAAGEVDGKTVVVEDGTVNAGHIFLTVSEVTTIDTDSISFTDITVATINLATQVTGTLAVGNGGTGQTTAKAARETGLGGVGIYTTATHGAGTSISITQATHGLRSQMGLIVQLQDASTGEILDARVTVSSGGDVTVTFNASQSANSVRVTILG